MTNNISIVDIIFSEYFNEPVMSMSEKASVIYEPMTSITDFLIFILGAIMVGIHYLYLILFSFDMGNLFFVLGFGALLGGVRHGFGPNFSKTQKKLFGF